MKPINQNTETCFCEGCYSLTEQIHKEKITSVPVVHSDDHGTICDECESEVETFVEIEKEVVFQIDVYICTSCFHVELKENEQ